MAARQRAAAEAAAAERALVVHEKNEWQIEVVPAMPADAGPGAAVAAGGGIQQLHALPEGLSFSHVRLMTCTMLITDTAGCLLCTYVPLCDPGFLTHAREVSVDTADAGGRGP